MSAVSMNTEVEVYLEELVDRLGPQQVEELKLLVQVRCESARAPDGRSIEQVIEAAFNATKAMQVIPPALADLFWLVHSRAMA